MSFLNILNRLLEGAPGGVSALFLDESGEVVEMVSTDLPQDEVRVLGAYLGIYLRQLGRFLASNRLGHLRTVAVEKDSLHLHALPLPEGYYLVLVQRCPAVVAHGRRSLLEAAEALRQDAFGGASA